jgi:hypothetical protein
MPEVKLNPGSVDWQAESFRLTAFLSPSAQVLEQDWWKTLTSEFPDRKTSELKIGLQQEEGKFKDEKTEGTLVLTVQPTRVDWQLIPPIDNLVSGFPTLGSFANCLDSFLVLMLRWIELAPPIQRLAFGAVLTKSVDSSKEGYQWVSSYLPFNLDEESSDFLYQINRPIKATSTENADLLINRLSKWSVNLLAGFNIDPIRPEQFISRLPQFSVRLELDINTTADPSVELNSEQLPQIFQELVELGRKIAIQGDQK